MDRFLFHRRGALLVAVLYVALSGLYIWVSSYLLFRFAGNDGEAVHRWKVAEGWVFIAVTSLAFYGLIRVNARAVLRWKRSERKSREAERKYRTLVELSPDAILIHQDGRIRFANAAAARLWGAKAPEELVGRNVLELVAPNFQEIVRERVTRSLREGVIAPALVEEFVRLDGTIFLGEATAASIIYRGRPAMEVIIRDVTEREKAEALMREGEKMQALGTLAAGVAHDFNNLLQAASLLVFSLQQKLGQVPQRQEELVTLERVLQRGASVTRQLLIFSRQEAAKLENVDLNEVVGNTTELLTRLLPAELGLRWKLADSPLVVRADRHQLEEVVMNLVLNARDATPKGGSVTVMTSGDEREVALVVSDTGTGIPEAIRHRIFEPFFTTKGPGKGTGLGLPVVKTIVEGLGGRIEFETEAHRGTTFRVHLPRAFVAGEAVAEVKRQEPLPPVEGIRVLLVEDDEAARESLTQVLSHLGCDVTAGRNGEEVNEFLATSPFDVLLTDFSLPGESGAQLAANFLTKQPNAIAVVMSGYAKAEVVKELIGEPRLFFLQKPFQVQQLVQVMAQVKRDQSQP